MDALARPIVAEMACADLDEPWADLGAWMVGEADAPLRLAQMHGARVERVEGVVVCVLCRRPVECQGGRCPS